jgi:uncharacterized protein (TIGR02246 family)
MKYLAIIGVALVITFCSCAPKPDFLAEKARVRAVVDSLVTCNETNNPELFAKLFSHSPDNVFFGTDSAERWVGYVPLMEAQKRSYASIDKGSQITAREVVVGIDKSGDAAWVSCLMDWKGKSQGQAFAFEGLRLTIVLENQNGKWEIVHVHGSVPVSGQAIKY